MPPILLSTKTAASPLRTGFSCRKNFQGGRLKTAPWWQEFQPSAYSASQRIELHHPGLHHQRYLLPLPKQAADVAQGVAIHDQQIRRGVGCQEAEAVAHIEHFGADGGGAREHFCCRLHLATQAEFLALQALRGA